MGRRTRKRKPLHRKRTLHRNMRGGRLDMKTLLQATVLFAKKNGIEYGVPVVATAPDSQSATTNKDFERKQTEYYRKQTEYYTKYYLLLRMSMDYADGLEKTTQTLSISREHKSFRSNIVVPFNEYLHKVDSGETDSKVIVDDSITFTNILSSTSTQKNLAKSIVDNLKGNNFQKVIEDSETLKASFPDKKPEYKTTVEILDVIIVLSSVAQFINTHPIDPKLLSKAKKTYSQPTGNATDITKQIDTLNTLYVELTTLGKEVNVLKTSDTSRVNPDVDALVKQISDDLVVVKVDDPKNTAADNQKKRELTHVLPYFLQIYEKLYSNAMDQKIEVNKHPVSTRLIMEFVTRKIREIETKHPHPELFDTMYYYWGLFDLRISLQFLDYYMNTIYDALSMKDSPGQIMTVVEKQLGDAGSFPEWDSDNTKPRGYKIYSKTVGQKRNPIMNANSDILALTSNPFKPYNPLINTFNTMLETNENGALQVVKNVESDIVPLDVEPKK